MIAPLLSSLKSTRAAVLTAFVLLVLMAWMSSHRTPMSRVWADEGTFLAMASSLALDGDLMFTEQDLDRLDQENVARSALILERTEKGIAYSKPVMLPLLAAPFWRLVGDPGMVLVNLLTLLGALCLAFCYLRRMTHGEASAIPDEGSIRPLKGPEAKEADRRALWLLLTLVFCATVVPYVFWRMADLLQFSLSLAGLVLCFMGRRPRPSATGRRWLEALDRRLDHPAVPWIGTVLVALTVNMRLSNGALLLIPVLADLFHRRWAKAVLKGALAASVVLLMSGFTWVLTGAYDPYRADRASFLPVTGYPVGEQAEEVLQRFDTQPATHYVRVYGKASQIAFSAFYFWLGRHTGLLFYFPAAVLFLVWALRRPSRISWACLIGAGIIFAFFILLKPNNYYGGGTFIGNRYFLSVYPVFLVALSRLPTWRWIAGVWVLALALYASAAVSVVSAPLANLDSQSHAYAGLFKKLPYESSSNALENTRKRYWSGQFVRFVDPFTKVTKQTFELEAGRPAGEVLVAHWQPAGRLRYLVECDAPEAKLVVEDWRERRVYSVGNALGNGGPVGIEIETGPPWRYHHYWFEQRPFWTRSFTLRLEAPAGTRARFHHLGDPEVAGWAFAYEALPMDLPSTGVVGESDEVTIRVRNTSRANWNADDVTAVTGRYRLWRNGELIFESGRLPIAERVPPGQELHLPVAVQWPEPTGLVTLELDLVLEHVDWFQTRIGQPLVRKEVRVEPAPD